jgi:cell division protein FtsW (lipid II flippase)
MTREQKSRLTALAESTAPDRRPSDDAYHLQQSKRMIALANTWGSLAQGDTASDRGAYRLPAGHTDFVFAVLCERLGLPGAAAMLMLFLLLIWRGAAVAIASREPYGRLLAAGITALFGVQVAINVAMTIGLAPVTGLSLPLVSYGGSGMLAHAIAVGLLMNVAARPGYEVGPEPFRYRLARAKVSRR